MFLAPPELRVRVFIWPKNWGKKNQCYFLYRHGIQNRTEGSHCLDLMVSPKIHTLMLSSPIWLRLEIGPLQRWLRLNEVRRVGWQSRITGLIIRRDSMDTPTQRRAREAATRRLPSRVQRGASGETKPATTLILGSPASRMVRRFLFNHQFVIFFIWQP